MIPITALKLREIAGGTAPGDFAIHIAGGPEHDTSSNAAECWCQPLHLTTEQIFAHTTASLQALLDEHYRIH